MKPLSYSNNPPQRSYFKTIAGGWGLQQQMSVLADNLLWLLYRCKRWLQPAACLKRQEGVVLPLRQLASADAPD